jgi:hypothetical protein
MFKHDPLSGKNLELIKIPVSTCATETERESDYFDVATSDYPTDTLSEVLKRKFSNADFERLTKIHDLRKSKLLIVSIKYYAGLVLAGATLVLKSIPKKVVEDNFGIIYEDFEVGVFWVMLVILAYVLLVLLPAWLMTVKAKYVHWYVGATLEYTAIKYK